MEIHFRYGSELRAGFSLPYPFIGRHPVNAGQIISKLERLVKASLVERASLT